MQDNLTRRDAIAVMVMQAIIIKREVLRLSPEQAALSALEHADASVSYTHLTLPRICSV